MIHGHFDRHFPEGLLENWSTNQGLDSIDISNRYLTPSKEASGLESIPFHKGVDPRNILLDMAKSDHVHTDLLGGPPLRVACTSPLFIIIGNFTKYALYISEGARNKCNKKYMFSKKRYMIQVYGGDKWNSKSDENNKNWLQKVQLTCK
jgi:hypothetical protein